MIFLFMCVALTWMTVTWHMDFYRFYLVKYKTYKMVLIFFFFSVGVGDATLILSSVVVILRPSTFSPTNHQPSTLFRFNVHLSFFRSGGL